MASWGSPRGSYRDESPNSPLSPLSPTVLPQWIRKSHARSGTLSNGRLKIILLASACLVLGWMVTSALGPEEAVLDFDESSYDAASAGVLNDPSGFGVSHNAEHRVGIVDEEKEEQERKIALQSLSKEPSVSGALADLHHAVKDKIHAWSPYIAKPAHHTSLTSPNGTADTKITNNLNLTSGGESITDGMREDERLGARVRIGKCTVMFNSNGIWERAVRTHEAHDRQHGYRLHVLRQELMDSVWSKPAYILSLLLRELAKPPSERLDWLFWVDVDTIILNPYVPIDTFLPPQGTEFDDVYLMYSNDWNGLNNGVFPIRVNSWAVNLFSAIVSYRHWKPEDPLTFRDQSAMNSLMQEPEFAKHVLQAPQRWFNAYQGEHNETLQPFSVRRGDLLVHFAGVVPREPRMEHWLDRAEQHNDDWEMPVKSTSYPQEARDFWNEQRGIRRDREQQLQAAKDLATKLMEATNKKLDDYGDRLTDEQKMTITAKRDELKKILEDSKTQGDQAKIEEATKNLSDSVSSLIGTIAEANKLLLQFAHEAIFAGERDLLEGGFNQGTTNPELELVSANVRSLKALIMTPEESWIRKDITAATDLLTEARARLQEKLDTEAAAKKKAEEEQAAQAKAQEQAQAAEDAKKAAEAQAAAAQAAPEAVAGGIMMDEVSQAASTEAAIAAGPSSTSSQEDASSALTNEISA